MRGVFDVEEPEQDHARRDTELTLGSGMLLAIFFGLVLLCGMCFGLGYAVGRHGPAEPAAEALKLSGDAQPALQSDGSRQKPSATAQPSAAHSPQSYGTNTPQSPPSGTSPNTTAGGDPSSGQPQVKPALANTPAAAQASTVPVVRPAMPQPPVSLLVQIAAVANPEDADVLLNALRKRGYTVTAKREPADNLIHVRIGPFTSRDEANRWRQKLLNDGYNAIILP